MKFFLKLPVILLIALSVSCGHRGRNLEPYGWEAVDAEFDSLLLTTENLMVSNAPRDSIEKYVARMERVADRNPARKVLRARSLFFRGQMEYTSGDAAAGDSLKREALALTDSARYPYDALRIRYFLDNDYHEPSVAYYNGLRGRLAGFMRSGDKVWSAALAMETGMFLVDLGDTRHGEEYLDTADSLLLACGFTEQLSTNRINRANLLTARRDTAGAVDLMRRSLADTVVPVNRFTRHILLGNLYSLTGDIRALREAYDSVTGYTNSEEFICLYAGSLTSEMVRGGQLDSARHYRRVARENIIDGMPPEALLAYYEGSHRLFAATGRPDSAYFYLMKENDLRRHMADENDRAEINNVTLYSRIENMRLQTNIERRNVVIVSLCVILSLLAAAGIVAMLFYRRIQHQKLARLEATLDKERSQRKALAMETLLQEKENVLHDMEHEMERLAGNGEISGQAARRIGAPMKVHHSQREQSDTFARAFEKLSPEFTRRLRKDYPSLTDADVRLASYIAMGMENKHIARVMSIRPESVKQARWRLRGKLGLAPGESLDDKMRGLAARD